LVGISVTTVPASATTVGALGNHEWAYPTNANADPAKISTFNVKFPVVGDALPGSGTYGFATDDFCYDDGGAHHVPNSGCRSGYGHRGVDIYPYRANAGADTLPVVAARGGQVKTAGCGAGPGKHVKIQGDDGRWYLYLHLARIDVAVSQSVRAGQVLGRMGNSTGCSANGTSVHLHFQVQTHETDQTTARDPYPSLRANFNRPGYKVTSYNPYVEAQTPYGLLTTAWNNVVAANGGYPTAMAGTPTTPAVGWPASSTEADGSVRWSGWYYTGGYYRSGYKQYLGTGDGGFDGLGKLRAGVLTQRDPPNGTAFWVHGLIWRRYSNMAGYHPYNEEDSFLGWPTSYEFRDPRGLTRQNFEGGCIANDGTGRYVPARYGSFPCT
jgi:murein DD-endopeptidase MepM/ murein hydrolase activator NlpD